MKRIIIFSLIVLGSFSVNSQSAISLTNKYTNLADNLLSKDSKLIVGGYGEVHYNQPLDGSVYNNGKLDVHRVVMLFGYNFTEKTQFVTELEFEHVVEVAVEQAFLQHKLNKYVNFRAGLMLVPMGIMNEYHEPPTFNGVERPLIDNLISPSTWREIGFGFTGNILPASIKYQAYMMNGFNGYDGSANLSGKSGLRKGRQKGAEAYISSPNFSGKVEYYGIRSLNIGLSGYIGNTQSTLYDGINKNNVSAMAMADSSVVGVTMLGIDARYNLKGFRLRSQFYYSSLSNSEQYNVFTANIDGTRNDVGSSMIGYYVEAGYNVLGSFETDKQLIPFVRYEFLNTHNRVGKSIIANPSYEKRIITTGLTLHLTQGAVIKADMHFEKSGADSKISKTFNAGIGIMF